MANNLRDLEGMGIVVKEFRTIGKVNREVLLRMLNSEHEQLGDGVDNPFHDLKKQWIDQGRPLNLKIQFIKEVRTRAKETSGLFDFGLKEAKDLVESW